MDKVHINTREYGPGQRLSYQEDILKNSPMVPNPVEYEDIDREMFKFVDERLVIVDDEGNSVPTFTLFSNQRSSEYTQMWEHTDNDGNLYMNFKTLNRESNPNFGTIHGGNYNIPGDNRFTLRISEVKDKNGVECYEVVSMSQPIQVDLAYRVSFVTSKYEKVNSFNEQLNKLFASKQCYINVNGHYMPLVVDNIDDETSYTIDERKFFIQSASLKLIGYIIPKDDIKTDLRPKRIRANPSLAFTNRTRVSLDFEGDDGVVLDIKFNEGVSKVTFGNDDDIMVKLDRCENARKVKIMINGDDYDASSWFRIQKGDEVKVSIAKPRQNSLSTVVFVGKLV